MSDTPSSAALAGEAAAASVTTANASTSAPRFATALSSPAVAMVLSSVTIEMTVHSNYGLSVKMTHADLPIGRISFFSLPLSLLFNMHYK